MSELKHHRADYIRRNRSAWEICGLGGFPTDRNNKEGGAAQSTALSMALRHEAGVLDKSMHGLLEPRFHWPAVDISMLDGVLGSRALQIYRTRISGRADSGDHSHVQGMPLPIWQLGESPGISVINMQDSQSGLRKSGMYPVTAIDRQTDAATSGRVAAWKGSRVDPDSDLAGMCKRVYMSDYTYIYVAFWRSRSGFNVQFSFVLVDLVDEGPRASQRP